MYYNIWQDIVTIYLIGFERIEDIEKIIFMMNI